MCSLRSSIDARARLLPVALLLAFASMAGFAGSAQSQSLPLTGSLRPCADGQAEGFACSNVDLLSFLPIESITGPGCQGEACAEQVQLNDIWGWTDPLTGGEYALVGRTEGTAFVDVSDPLNPIYLGDLPTHTDTSIWRDIKVYQNHAFIVADAAGAHGMQVFDLTELRNVPNPPVTFTETAHYDGINSAHNIVIDEETGFAYSVGNSGGGQTCGGGLHMIDISNPTEPAFAGCFADPSTGRIGTGYTHDAQCLVYRGPDTEHQGREICFGSNETALSIADVSDKSNPVALSATTYPNVAYAHQGWVSQDQRYYFVNDELDELAAIVPQTRTLVWDIADLDDPQLVKEYYYGTQATDHNLYIKGNWMYQANYFSGLRIHHVSRPEQPVEAGFFDTTPIGADGPGFDGAWSNYPYFESGIILISSISQGLFVLQPAASITDAIELPEPIEHLDLVLAGPNPFQTSTTVELRVPEGQDVTVAVFDMLGREVRVLHQANTAPGVLPLTFEADELPSGTYFIQARSREGVVTVGVTLVR